MRDIELNHLKYFYYTVLEGGVAQAANRLCVQQPVVSKMLKSLEEDLGQALFFKKGRSKQLTDYGQLIFRHSQVVFDEISKIQTTSDNPNELKGVLNLGAAEPVMNYVLSPLIEKVARKYPNVNLNAYTTTQTHILDMISNGNLELGLLFYAPNLQRDLEIVQKRTYPFRLVIKKGRQNDKATIESFIGSREIDDVSTHSFPTVEFIRKKYPKTRITISSNSITLHKQLVLNGQGVSILPEFVIEKELKRGSLVDVFPSQKFSWDLMLIKRKSSHLNRPAQSLCDLLG